jgi:hypothetical protein
LHKRGFKSFEFEVKEWFQKILKRL